jgi:hypothetical protein
MLWPRVALLLAHNVRNYPDAFARPVELRGSHQGPSPRLPASCTNRFSQRQPHEYAPMNALIDLYRCPESFAKFKVAADVINTPGYFRFGNTVCYGRSSAGSSPHLRGNSPRNLLEHVTANGSQATLPFSPSEIIDNLRLERYALDGYAGKQTILSSRALQKIYYSIRPCLQVSVRKHFQRLFHRNWEDLTFPSWPVDCSVENILESLLSLSMKSHRTERIPFIWFWPQGAPSCVIMTHDVETKAGTASIPRLMDVDDEFRIKASFQVIPQKQYPVSMSLLDEIRTRGFELNVQDLTHSGNLFDDRATFLDCARSINRYAQEYGAQGFRAGRMYRNADWYEALDISYDMSIPNVAHLEPQRGGCCTVFPYFVGRILELPLTTTQDYSLLHILGEYSTELWKKQVSLITEKHGLASFIVHPDYIMEKRSLEVYRNLSAYLADLRDQGKVWLPLPREVNRWWRQRSEMRLVRRGGGWEIVGPGKEQARLAYASLENNRVVYTLEPEGQEQECDGAGLARARSCR